jgi:hypothetical protein
MADAWLLSLATGAAVGVFILLTLAGMGLVVGLFLAAVIWLAARSATTPEGRSTSGRVAAFPCDRLPFCD